jgi:hypothetical protein
MQNYATVVVDRRQDDLGLVEPARRTRRTPCLLHYLKGIRRFGHGGGTQGRAISRCLAQRKTPRDEGPWGLTLQAMRTSSRSYRRS